jgi:hypothetical protein
MPDLVGSDWQRNHSGLYVPPDNLSAYERTDLKHTRWQAWAAIAGAVFALLALIGSGAALVYTAKAWDEQKTLNEQQIALNKVTKERERRVYSSRVALWATVGTDFSSVRPAGIDINVQNRSPVPLRRMRLLVPIESGRIAELRIEDLPPCSGRTMRIAPPAGERFAATSEQWLGYAAVTLEFEETGRFWRLGDKGLTQLDAESATNADQLQRTTPTERSVTDCGEGA